MGAAGHHRAVCLGPAPALPGVGPAHARLLRTDALAAVVLAGPVAAGGELLAGDPTRRSPTRAALSRVDGLRPARRPVPAAAALLAADGGLVRRAVAPQPG